MKLEKITDAGVPGCATAPVKPNGPGEEVVEASASAAYTKAGTFTNVAVVEGNHKQKESNKVEVELEPTQGFEVVKKQRFAGEWSVCDGQAVGRTPPQTVEYEVFVRNTGKRRLS